MTNQKAKDIHYPNYTSINGACHLLSTSDRMANKHYINTLTPIPALKVHNLDKEIYEFRISPLKFPQKPRKKPDGWWNAFCSKKKKGGAKLNGVRVDSKHCSWAYFKQ